MKTKIFIFVISVIFNSSFLIHNCQCQIWSPLGSGMGGTLPVVNSLTVYNNELIAGGYFTIAGGDTVNCIAKWNGTVWSPLGSGLAGGMFFSFVNALTVYNNELIAGGEFSIAGGVSANRIAKWNGTVWSPLGSGMQGNETPYPNVWSLAVYPPQAGELIAGGQFYTAGGVSAFNIAKWNGTTWSPLGSGINSIVLALTVYNNELIAGGEFSTAGGVSANRIAKWNGTTWAPLGSGMNNTVHALTIYNNELIAGGYFSTAGGVSANRIAKWNGTTWSPLGSEMNGDVLSLHTYNNELIAGGAFSTAGGVSANKIAKWNGTTWSPLGSGMGGGSNPCVVALTVFNNELIAGGLFTSAGGLSANSIAKWGGPSGLKIVNQNTPEKFELFQNYPNPFNPVTSIKFKVASVGQSSQTVTLKVFNMLGKEVTTLVNEKLQPGSYKVTFDAGNLPSGVYFYKLTAGEFTDTKRMILIK